jgi:hypothetical protein
MQTVIDLDTDALLAGMAQKPKSKGKSVKPSLTDATLDKQVALWMDASLKEKEWESIKVTAEAQILAFAAAARLEACRQMGREESTFLVNGKLAMTQKCQYSAVPMECLPALQEAFGEEAQRYFVTKTELALTPAAVADKEVLRALVAALGPARFAECFTVKKSVAVTETFHHDFTLKAEVEAKARDFIDQGVIKPFKPSLKVA